MFNDPPPWVIVPDMNPDDPDAHGIAEAYILLDWLRSWQLMPDAQQAAYLDRWETPSAWRAAIAERYHHYPVDLDLNRIGKPQRSRKDRPISAGRSWWRRLWRYFHGRLPVA